MKHRVLVADDDQAILESITLILEDAGYVVETSSDGETIQKIHSFQPEVILLDMWMSGIDGRDICREVKKQTTICHIPVIMISASRNVKQASDEVGADDFIEKPFEMDVLLEKVEQHIEKRQSS